MLSRRKLTGLLSLALLFALAGSAACEAATEPATRVALVSGEGRDAIANVVDLALAKLAADERFVMLERDEIRRVLEEQKLTASGLVDATQVISVGKLLTTDLFAVVETAPADNAAAGDDTAAGIIVFDARSGVRYWDAALPNPGKDLDSTAQAILSAIQQPAGKRSRQQTGLHTVGFVTVRNADLPRSQDGLCEAVGFLAERGLPRSPDVAVLERRRLERVNAERALPTAEAPTDLLASLSTVELEIARGGGGKGLQATALLKLAGQEEPQRVTAAIADMNAAELADALVTKLISALQAAPAAGTADRLVEAKRYDREAAHHDSHERYADTVRAEEAAHALDPASQDYAGRLSMYLIRYAVYLFSPAQRHHTKGGDRAWTDTPVEPPVFETLMAAANRSVDIDLELAHPAARLPGYDLILGMMCDRLRGYRATPTNASVPLADEFLLRCRRRSLDFCETWAGKAEADPKKLDAYTTHLALQLRTIKSASVDTAQYADCVAQIARRWLEVTKDWQPEFNQTDGGEAVTMLLQDFVTPLSWPWPCDEREFAQTMAPLYDGLQQHSRPLVRLYGHCGVLRSDILLERDAEGAIYARFASVFRPLAESIIESPAPWHPQRTRFAAYDAWRMAIGAMPGKAKTKHEFEVREVTELCEFALERGELEGKTLQQAFTVLDSRGKLDLIARALPAVDSPQFKGGDGEKARLRSRLKTTEQQILVAEPNLAKEAAKLPWTKSKKLWEFGQFPELSELAACVPVADGLYAVFFQFDKDRAGLRLIHIPLSGEKAELLSHADLAVPTTAVPVHLRPRYVTATAIDDDFLYLATSGAGIVALPLKGDQSRRFNVAEGLPSNNVRSIAILGGKIYAGFEDGYLVSIDPQSGKCDVLASSRRKQKQSPFDDGEVFRVPTLVADPARQRLVFVIGERVWQLTPPEGKITSLINLAEGRGRWDSKLTGPEIYWSSPVRGDRVLIANAFHTIEIDLAHDRAVEISSPEHGIFPTWPPQLVIDGWLWCGGTFSRLSLDKGEYQALPSPEPEKRGWTFRPTICLELSADQRQLIAAATNAIWLYDLERP